MATESALLRLTFGRLFCKFLERWFLVALTNGFAQVVEVMHHCGKKGTHLGKTQQILMRFDDDFFVQQYIDNCSCGFALKHGTFTAGAL